MYGGDHIVISASLAAISYKNLDKKFPKLVVISLLMNHIDLDHIFFYKFDDGSANSLILHPLHLYSCIPLLGLYLLGSYNKKYTPYLLMAAGSYVLHLTADSLAYFVHYSIPILMVIGLTLLGLSYWVFKLNSVKNYKKVWLYFFCCWLVMHGVQGGLHFVLKLNPQQSIFPWTFPHAVLLAMVGLFWLLFKETNISNSKQ